MYFHTDEQWTLNFLASVLTIAAKNGQRVRIDVDHRGHLRIKRAGGVWSAPLHGTFDPFRDSEPENRPTENPLTVPDESTFHLDETPCLSPFYSGSAGKTVCDAHDRLVYVIRERHGIGNDLVAWHFRHQFPPKE